jgi:diguanylate cyclase (GGDEF)-like protein/PAS domain S-box-containing protein
MVEDGSGAPSPLTEAARDAVLSSLLQKYPEGLISAINAEGLFVEMPDHLELHGQHVAGGVSALSLVAADYRNAVIEAWHIVLRDGASTVPVVLSNGVPARYHFVDARHRYGVLFGVVVSQDGSQLEVTFYDRPPVLPKTGRIDKDGLAVIRHADHRICLMLGFEVDELVGTRSLDLIHPDDQTRAIDAWMDMLAAPGGTTRLRARHLRKDGSWLWLELTNTNRLDEPEGRVVTEMMDISDEMDALEALRRREQLLGRLTEALPSGVLHFDADLRVIYANGRLHDLLGVPPATTVFDQLATVADVDRLALEDALRAVARSGRDTDLAVTLQRPGDAQMRHCSIAIRVLSDADGAPDGGVLCIEDVTEAWRLRAELERRATIDELTGCLNRPAVLGALEEQLAAPPDGRAGTAVVFLDLDGFKEVNDTFGHHVGDELLATLAGRLRDAMRPHDVVGRLGGDEFIVVLHQVSDETEALTIARRIQATLAEPVEVVGGVPMQICSSVGVAWAGADRLSADSLIAAADRAMYESKRGGLSAVVLASV